MKSFSKDEISKLKEVFGPLHKVDIEGTSYILRTLNRKELASLDIFSEDIDTDKEEEIVKLAIIHPLDIDYDNLSAGVITTLSEIVLDKSGLLGIESLQNALEKAREKRTIFSEIYEMICAAFPTILPGDLDNITLDKLMDLFVIAEGILIKTGIIEQEVKFELEGDDGSPGGQNVDVTAQMLQKALDEAKQEGYI